MANSDNELVSLARAGNAAAFDELVSRHQGRVFALAYHVLGNAEDAADVQQDAFLNAWTNLPRFRGEAAFATWLHRITVNACLSRKRRKDWGVEREPVSENSDYTRGASPVLCQERAVNAVIVRDLLSAIPANHRIVLVLREVEGMSMEEIAGVTGSSVGAVKKRLYRVRKLFGERLRRQLMEDE